MRPINGAQLTKIHVLLNQFGLMSDKADIIRQFTNGRETSSKQMTFNEASDLLQHLSKFDSLDLMRRKIFALAYSAGMIWGDSKEDKQINSAKINIFLKEKGTIKKDLNKMNKAELIKVVNQFIQINKHKEESKISKETKSMLSEVGISTSKNGAINPL